MKSSSKDIVLLLAGFLPAAVLVFLAFVLVPGCIGAYAPVSGQLPPQTRFVFSFYYPCLGLPVLVMFVWSFWPKRLRRGIAAAGFGIVGSRVAFVRLVGNITTTHPIAHPAVELVGWPNISFKADGFATV